MVVPGNICSVNNYIIKEETLSHKRIRSILSFLDTSVDAASSDVGLLKTNYQSIPYSTTLPYHYRCHHINGYLLLGKLVPFYLVYFYMYHIHE